MSVPREYIRRTYHHSACSAATNPAPDATSAPSTAAGVPRRMQGHGERIEVAREEVFVVEGIRFAGAAERASDNVANAPPSSTLFALDATRARSGENTYYFRPGMMGMRGLRLRHAYSHAYPPPDTHKHAPANTAPDFRTQYLLIGAGVVQYAAHRRGSGGVFPCPDCRKVREKRRRGRTKRRRS